MKLNRLFHRPRHEPQTHEEAKRAALTGLSGQSSSVQVVRLESATAFIDLPPAELTAVRQLVLAKGNGRKAVRLWCDGPGKAVFGGPGVTLLSGTPVASGSGYVESDAPDAEFYALTDTPGTTLRIIPMQ